MTLRSVTREGYTLTIELYAAYNHIAEAEALAQIREADFLTRLNDLHTRHMGGEFTASKLADLLGIPALNLYDLLETLELPVRYY